MTLCSSPARFALCALLALNACHRHRRLAERAAPPARLVVAVVLDQVGSWVLERAMPRLSPHGALRRTIARGAYHHRVRYNYAGTYTAPGHAAIFTGAPPEDSGIPANKVWDEARRRAVAVLDDGRTPVFGHTEVSSNPSRLRAETVGDVLQRETHGRGRVVSLSLKDRGAAIPGGQHPDAALWYDEQAREFTTSAYYGAAPPAWLTRWNTAHPTASRLTVWSPLPGTAPLEGRDDARGEGDWHGLGTTFPHDLAAATAPYSALLAAPQGTELLLDVALAAVEAYDLGRDTAPDLLALSISGTDYAGHVFGPESWEAVDHLVRADLALGAFLSQLEAQHRGPVAVLITADHGVARLPEANQAGGHAAERLEPEALRDIAQHAAEAALGPGTWVDAFVQPLLYLSAAGRDPAVRPRVIAAALTALRATPGIARAFDTRAPLAAREDPLVRMVSRSIDRRAPGDAFIVPAENSVVDEQMPEGAGTSHGSPWAYDTDVPVLIAGPGVAHLETTAVLPEARVASTLAALLRVPPPHFSDPTLLPGVRGVQLRR